MRVNFGPGVRVGVTDPGVLPSDFSNLVVWYDAADLVASPVASWPDKSSGGSHNATEGTNQPTLTTGDADFNSTNSVLFNGTDDLLSADSAGASFSGTDIPWTFLAAIKFETALTFRAAVSTTTSTGSGARNDFLGSLGGGANWRVFRDGDSGASKDPTVAVDDTSPHIFTGISTGTAVDYWVGGGAKDLTAGDIDVVAMTVDQFTLGCQKLGGTPAAFANISIARLAIWNTNHTPAALNPLAVRWAAELGLTHATYI